MDDFESNEEDYRPVKDRMPPEPPMRIEPIPDMKRLIRIMTWGELDQVSREIDTPAAKLWSWANGKTSACGD
jgi:hypothetical protein